MQTIVTNYFKNKINDEENYFKNCNKIFQNWNEGWEEVGI